MRAAFQLLEEKVMRELGDIKQILLNLNPQMIQQNLNIPKTNYFTVSSSQQPAQNRQFIPYSVPQTNHQPIDQYPSVPVQQYQLPNHYFQPSSQNGNYQPQTDINNVDNNQLQNEYLAPPQPNYFTNSRPLNYSLNLQRPYHSDSNISFILNPLATSTTNLPVTEIPIKTSTNNINNSDHMIPMKILKFIPIEFKSLEFTKKSRNKLNGR
jgi:hypothetical protein